MPFFTNKKIVFFFNWEMLVKEFVDSYLKNSWKHVVSSIIDKKNKNKMKKTIEINEDLETDDMDLLQYDADMGAEKAILKNMA